MKIKEHFTAIILAAGLSSRMGCTKQLLEIDGQTMLDRAVETVLDAGIANPIVVLGHNANEIRDKVKLLTHCTVVTNESYRTGMASSLRCGVRAVTSQTSAYLFMLCDQPLVDSTLIKELIKEFTRKKADILCPLYQGKRGNPVIISSKLHDRLLEAEGDSGARFLFADKDLNIVGHPVSTHAIIMDIDTPEDLLNVTKTLTRQK